MVRLNYAVELNYFIVDLAGADLVLNIHPAQTAHQSVESERLALSQAVTPVLATDAATGSRHLRVHAGPGPLRVNYEAVVRIEHHRADPDTLAEVPVRALPLEVLPYVVPSRYCESDRLLRLAADEFGRLRPGHGRVLAVQQWVQRHVTFRPNSSTSTTSALDTLIGRVGVCRDFAHLMVALCRALNIPARVATGTDYGADPTLGPPDFHAYAEVYLGDRWYLFDASGTAIPMGLMRLGTGRDAADVAFATLFGQISAAPPRVSTTALQTGGAELPRHGREALSTAAGPWQPPGRAAMTGNAEAMAPAMPPEPAHALPG